MSSRRRVLQHSGIGLALALLVLPFGCSSKDKSEIKVAEVEDRVITLEYFEQKMSRMDPKFLPENIDTQEGREELLETMINKEVMALKAEELGMDADGMAEKQGEKLSELKAVNKMRADVVAKAQNPTEKQILDYYEMLPRKLTVSYMLFDQLEQAQEAFALVDGGEQWVVVAKKFNAGDPGPTGNYTLTMRYGTVADDLERAVFELPVGGVSQPIDSIYGWFLVRVDDVTLERVQPLDSMRDKVVQSVVKQGSDLAVRDFIDEVFAEYNFTIDEEVLQACFDALPDDYPLNPPPPIENLEPLRVQTKDLDRILMSFGDRKWTVQEFKELYEGSSPFARPMRGKRIGGMRRFLKELAMRELMTVVARDRGYMDDPEVREEYKTRREQRMVAALHQELIAGQVEVSAEAMDEFWAEHKEEYYVPELREALAVITNTEAEALSAQIDHSGGATWEEIVDRYCIESDIKRDKGKIGKMRSDVNSPLAPHVFALETEGQVSFPVELPDGKWALIKLLSIEEPRTPELGDIRAQVGQRLRAQLEEEEFNRRVEEWKAGYRIVRYPKHLMDAVLDESLRSSNTIDVKIGG